MRTPATYLITSTPQGYTWQLLDADQRLIAQSCDPLPTLQECRSTIEFVRGSWKAAIQEEAVHPATQPDLA